MENKRLLIIGFVWPEPNSSAAGSRMMQLIEVFQSQNYEVTFATPCAKSNNAFNLESINVIPVSIALNNSDFDAFVKALNPKIVLFDRFMMEEQFGWRVAEQCPETLRVLDTEDLHCLRKGRHKAFKENQVFNSKYLFNDIAKREIASIYRCDLSLMISEVEIEILKHEFKVEESLLLYLPFMLDKIDTTNLDGYPKFSERQHFITIGNFLHEPNYNAVLYLKETIWPLIKKQLPKSELHIYGAYATQRVNQLHNEKQGFLVKGFAESVNAVMQKAKICLVPVRFGAGLKGKLVDAMQNGTPCVMTSVGAEGMFGTLDVNGCIEDNSETFANKALELYQNETIWNAFQRNGYEIINERFNKIEHQQSFVSKIKEVINQLDERRLNNFTGQMLLHHTMQSTKFMSRWIEEKNKVN